ncbi:hypothetical protein U1Q18_041978 [Sarracenia purpurea var. burkii]
MAARKGRVAAPSLLSRTRCRSSCRLTTHPWEDSSPPLASSPFIGDQNLKVASVCKSTGIQLDCDLPSVIFKSLPLILR